MTSTLPRRLSPRRTRRVLGFRATPKVADGFIGGLAASILLVASTDLPDRLLESILS